MRYYWYFIWKSITIPKNGLSQLACHIHHPFIGNTQLTVKRGAKLRGPHPPKPPKFLMEGTEWTVLAKRKIVAFSTISHNFQPIICGLRGFIKWFICRRRYGISERQMVESGGEGWSSAVFFFWDVLKLAASFMEEDYFSTVTCMLFYILFFFTNMYIYIYTL